MVDKYNSLGGKINYNSKVEEIIALKGRVTAVKSKGSLHTATAVVAACDMYDTLKNMLGGKYKHDELDKMLHFNYFTSKEEVYEELVRIGLQGPESVLKFNASITSPIEIFQNITDNIFNALKVSSMSAKMFLLMSQAANSETAPEKVK